MITEKQALRLIERAQDLGLLMRDALMSKDERQSRKLFKKHQQKQARLIAALRRL